MWSPMPPRGSSGMPSLLANCTESPERAEGPDVVGRPIAVLAPQAIPADTAVDETGVALDGRPRFEAETVERVGTQIRRGRRRQSTGAPPPVPVIGRRRSRTPCACLGCPGRRRGWGILADAERADVLRIGSPLGGSTLMRRHPNRPAVRRRTARRPRHPSRRRAAGQRRQADWFARLGRSGLLGLFGRRSAVMGPGYLTDRLGLAPGARP